MSYTISTHTGTVVAVSHNIRDRRITDKESHIDPNGIHETWKHESQRHAYHRLFDQAQANYNAKQSRPERKIRDYYSSIAKDSKKHPCYEMIIAIGNRENPPPVDTAKKIMRDFVDGWHDRNPNMELIGAYYHADEQGVPHVHIDFIPVATGFSRGMSTQASYSRALSQMGFTGRMAAAQWWGQENQHLEDLCNQNGLEIEHPDAGSGRAHAEKAAYQILAAANQELRNAEAVHSAARIDLELAELQKSEAAQIKAEAQKSVDVSKQQIADLEAQHRQLLTIVNMAQGAEGLVSDTAQATQLLTAAKKDIDELKASPSSPFNRSTLRVDSNLLQRLFDILENAMRMVCGIVYKFIQMGKENDQIKIENRVLRGNAEHWQNQYQRLNQMYDKTTAQADKTIQDLQSTNRSLKYSLDQTSWELTQRKKFMGQYTIGNQPMEDAFKHWQWEQSHSYDYEWD